MGMPDRKNWSAIEARGQTVGEFLEASFPGRDIAEELERGLRLVERLVDRLSAIIERVAISACGRGRAIRPFSAEA
jgi:hypothetical protein